jgi:hypothetical protein
MGFWNNILNKLEEVFETEYNAGHAKTKTERIRREKINEEIHYIHDLIDSAVKRGEFSISYRIKYEENVDYFKKLGYDVQPGYSYKISWKETGD